MKRYIRSYYLRSATKIPYAKEYGIDEEEAETVRNAKQKANELEQKYKKAAQDLKDAKLYGRTTKQELADYQEAADSAKKAYDEAHSKYLKLYSKFMKFSDSDEKIASSTRINRRRTSRYIRATEIIPNRKMQVGMYWNIDGHDTTVTWISKDRKKCKITEEWISEDTYNPKKSTEVYDIRVDKNGTEYAKNTEYDDYEDIGVFYSTGAFNYPYESVVDDSDEESWDDDWDGEDDYYTPSATAGDYGPGNPWDSPGYSIKDFI